ncbi:MAG: hypothetical protein DMD26_09670 [Gemmatimonadetes bacterium]|nr:MAG: hypothetical protein DMD26_09670 [Gemmatimonadota bacterium]
MRISELHYDNAGTDAGEAIEISGPAGTLLGGWSIVLYNGADSLAYNTTQLSGSIPATCGTRGVVVVNYPVNGIQNGSPDGIALVDPSNSVVEFLSYEGKFSAKNGPASGTQSTDIGVLENGSGAIGLSLQLLTDGWSGPSASTFGACNDQDAVITGPIDIITVTPNPSTIATTATQQFVAAASDAAGTPVTGAALTWTSDATGVATVDANGLATPKAVGDATITATAANGVFGSAVLHVQQPTTELPHTRFSEIHYDNAGTDAGEAIEIEGPAGQSLSGWSIVLYDGNGGGAYNTTTLSGSIPATCAARGVIVMNYPVNGIQNGSPDGFALVDDAGHVVEFLSYEGTFTAVGGPASGKTSTDIGTSENSSPIGQSLQRDASGMWSLLPATFGLCNPAGSTPGNIVTFSGRAAVSDPPLPIGFEAQLFATLKNGATTLTTTFTWTSETPAIASVDQNGVIRALAAGTATFRATAGDGTTGRISLPTTDAKASTTALYGHNTEFGTPVDADPSDDFIVARSEYTLSYNKNRGTPNWVSYGIDSTDFGDQDRCDCFTFDPALPASFTHLTTADYTGAGAAAGYSIDRGHMVRSFDRTSESLDNARTFYLSNVAPQASDLNQGPWAVLETFLGDQARLQNKEVYVIAGVAGNKGTVKNEGKIVIPASTWKVALIMPHGGSFADVHGIGDVQVVAVNMPNEPGVRNVDWHTYQTTVDAIEALTGYDLLSRLPDNIEIPLEANDHAPSARIAGAAAGSEGTPMSFIGTSSTDTDPGDVLTYSWEFGDGRTDVGSTPVHTFLDNGAYTVKLTVTDRFGLASSATTTVTVANVAPVPRLASASGSLVATSGIPFGIIGTFSDAGVADAPWGYTITWGDGNTPTGQTSDMRARIDASNTYRRAGTYSVTFSVTDKDASTGMSQLSVNVLRRRVTAMAQPGMINLNDRGQGGVDVVLLSRLGFDATQLVPASATIGGVPLDTHGDDDKLSYHVEDANGDGFLDVKLRFSRAALIEAGALSPTSTELVLLADLLDGTQIEGHATVQTKTPGGPK